MPRPRLMIGRAIATACLLLTMAGAVAADPLAYEGHFDCGDMSTMVSFVHDPAAGTITDFQIVDVCSARVRTKVFGQSSADIDGKVTGRWRTAAVMKVRADGSFSYNDRDGNHVQGVIGPAASPHQAQGVVGRPKIRLAECGKGQFFMPCVRWAAAPKP